MTLSRTLIWIFNSFLWFCTLPFNLLPSSTFAWMYVTFFFDLGVLVSCRVCLRVWICLCIYVCARACVCVCMCLWADIGSLFHLLRKLNQRLIGLNQSPWEEISGLADPNPNMLWSPGALGNISVSIVSFVSDLSISMPRHIPTQYQQWLGMSGTELHLVPARSHPSRFVWVQQQCLCTVVLAWFCICVVCGVCVV